MCGVDKDHQRTCAYFSWKLSSFKTILIVFSQCHKVWDSEYMQQTFKKETEIKEDNPNSS